MSAKSLHRLRLIVLYGGGFLAVLAAISIAVWERQTGQRVDLKIEFLEPREREGVKAEPIPTPAIVGVASAVVAFGIWAILGWIPCKCPLCGAMAVYPKHEARRLSLYRCGKCHEVDPSAPAIRSAKQQSASRGY